MEVPMTAVRELRFAFTVDDYDGALSLFRDIFGLQTIEEFQAQGGRGILLDVPVATLEIFDNTHTDVIDMIEVGRQLGERARIAARVDDLPSASDSVRGLGAQVLAPPVTTPWGDRNQRFRACGLQLTLFQSPK